MTTNPTEQRRQHIKRLLDESGELSAQQVKDLFCFYNVSSSTIYCDVAYLKKSPTYYRVRATHQVASENIRARKLGIEGYIKTDEWLALCEGYGNICLCCKKEGLLTIDHVTPLSKGGTNSLANIQPLCIKCNLRKHTSTIDYRPFYIVVVACAEDELQRILSQIPDTRRRAEILLAAEWTATENSPRGQRGE